MQKHSDSPKVLFIVPERLEFVKLARSLFLPLLKKNITLEVVVIETHETYLPVLNEAKEILNIANVPFRCLTEYGSKNALEILLEKKPLLVITDNDQEPERRAFVLAAKKLNLPILVLRETVASIKSHANFMKTILLIFRKLGELPRISKKYLFYYKSLLAIQPTFLINAPQVMNDLMHLISNPTAGELADYVCTNTVEEAQLLRKFCPQVRYIRPVGNPRFDDMLNLPEQEIEKIRREIQEKFHICKNKKILLFLSSSQVEHGYWNERQKLQVNAQILASLLMFQEKLDVVIKLHPVEKNVFQQIWKPIYNDFIHVSSYDISKLILASDIVITWYSTAMVNVVLFKKPLIAIDFYGDRQHGNVLLSTKAIVEQGAALEATSVTELCDSISAILKDDELRNSLKNLQETFHKATLKTMDGYSTVRIADMIIEIAGASANKTARTK
jgi:CDP-glycerol glycerophosphotransferase (TagB/SpsB family)